MLVPCYSACDKKMDFEISLFICYQAALWMVQSVCSSICPSICLSYLFHYVNIIVSWNFQDLLSMTKVRSIQKSRSEVKVQGHRGEKPNLVVSGSLPQFKFTDGYEMMHKAWSSIENMPYCFSRSSIKLQGHTGWKINDLILIWVRLLGRSQLSNPSDLPCFVFFKKMHLKIVSTKKQSQNWGSVRFFFWTKTFSDLFIEISFKLIPESFIEDKISIDSFLLWGNNHWLNQDLWYYKVLQDQNTTVWPLLMKLYKRYFTESMFLCNFNLEKLLYTHYLKFSRHPPRRKGLVSTICLPVHPVYLLDMLKNIQNPIWNSRLGSASFKISNTCSVYVPLKNTNSQICKMFKRVDILHKNIMYEWMLKPCADQKMIITYYFINISWGRHILIETCIYMYIYIKKPYLHEVDIMFW